MKINYNCSIATIIWLANCIPVQKQARKNFFPRLVSDTASFVLRVIRFFFKKKSNLKYHGFNNLSCFKPDAKWGITSVGAVTREHGSWFLLDLRWEYLSSENYSKHLFDIVGRILIWEYQCSRFCSEEGASEGGWDILKVSKWGICLRKEAPPVWGLGRNKDWNTWLWGFWISLFSHWQFWIQKLSVAFCGTVPDSRPVVSIYG